MSDRFYVGKFDESKLTVPHGYEKHSQGYERCPLVDHSVGSVHMGVGISQLQPKGTIEFCVHANEKGIYILDGEVEMKRGCEVFRLSKDDYALIPYGVSHAFRNTSNQVVRWFEIQAPQPKPPGGWQDTFFVGDADWPRQVSPPDMEDVRTRGLGHFKGQRPMFPGGIGIHGPTLTVYRFMEREFGAQHFFMMRGELSVGSARGPHDHAVEECYFSLSGEADKVIEGKPYRVRPGDVVWAGVGTSHGLIHRGDVPYRWMEIQSPQFPTQNFTRDYAHWDKLRAGIKSKT